MRDIWDIRYVRDIRDIRDSDEGQGQRWCNAPWMSSLSEHPAVRVPGDQAGPMP